MDKQLIMWVTKIIEKIYDALLANPKVVELMMRRNPTIKLKLGKFDYNEQTSTFLKNRENGDYVEVPKTETVSVSGIEIEISSNIDGTKLD
jgi:hypothetical protein